MKVAAAANTATNGGGEAEFTWPHRDAGVDDRRRHYRWPSDLQRHSGCRRCRDYNRTGGSSRYFCRSLPTSRMRPAAVSSASIRGWISSSGTTRILVFTDKDQANEPKDARMAGVQNAPVSASQVVEADTPAGIAGATFDHDNDSKTLPMAGMFTCAMGCYVFDCHR